jgi:hypothetical protein
LSSFAAKSESLSPCLSEALKEALDEMAGPVARAHDATKGSVWQMGHDRDWAEARSTGP